MQFFLCEVIIVALYQMSHFVRRFQHMTVDILKELKMTGESLLEDIQISVIMSAKCQI